VNENTPEVNSFRLALVLGNDSKDPEAVAKFLRSLPVEKIIEAQHNVLTEEVNIYLDLILSAYQFIVIILCLNEYYV